MVLNVLTALCSTTEEEKEEEKKKDETTGLGTWESISTQAEEGEEVEGIGPINPGMWYYFLSGSESESDGVGLGGARQPISSETDWFPTSDTTHCPFR